MKLAMVLICAATASAQVFSILSTDTHADEVAVTFLPNARAMIEQPVEDAPYSADRVLKAAGKDIIQPVYRDSKGRTRTEGIAGETLVEIVDPVGHVAYLIDDAHKIAHRVALATPEAVPLTSRGAAGLVVSGGVVPTPVNPVPDAKLVNLRRGEPDAALFQVPRGYKTVDEKSTFRITFSK